MSEREREEGGGGCRKKKRCCQASDEGGFNTYIKDITMRRGYIAEVNQFDEGARIKAWGQRSEWGRLGMYSGEGSSTPPPPHLPHPN